MSDKLTETVELEPCPFCGGPWGVAQEPTDNHPIAGMWYLYHRTPRCFFAISPSHFASQDEAITAWNTRAALSRPNVNEMREALKHAGDAIASLPEDALGMAQIAFGGPEDVYPLRNELLSEIDAALRGSADNGS